MEINHQMVEKLLYWLRKGKADTIDHFISSLKASDHRLLQEFFAAVYLVSNPHAWKALFVEIERKSQESTSRDYLADVLRPMGLENVIRFIVSLSPSHGQELCSLFVIKQQEVFVLTSSTNFNQSVYSYELELLQACSDDRVKSAMAEALIRAPVITVSGDQDHAANNSGAEKLVDMFPKESFRFLDRAYGWVVEEDLPGQVTVSSHTANNGMPFICDSYAMRCLQEFHCTALDMGTEMMVVYSDIRVDLLPLLTSSVSEGLRIRDCKLLCKGNDAKRRGLANKMQAESPTLRMDLEKVSGRQQLRDCDITLPNVGELWLRDCGNVNICELSQTFANLWKLGVGGGRLMYSADFRPLQDMRDLTLNLCDGEVRLSVLSQLCPRLASLWIKHLRPVSFADVSSQWLSLWKLSLWSVDEVKLCTWTQFCPSLEELEICGASSSTDVCALCIDGVDVSQCQSLMELWLSDTYLVQRGRRLTEEEARQTLTDIWPSARIWINFYKVTLCTRFTFNTGSCLWSFTMNNFYRQHLQTTYLHTKNNIVYHPSPPPPNGSCQSFHAIDFSSILNEPSILSCWGFCSWKFYVLCWKDARRDWRQLKWQPKSM